jgi:hypothetical protein
VSGGFGSQRVCDRNSWLLFFGGLASVNLTFCCLFETQVLCSVSGFWALCKNGLQMTVAQNMKQAYFFVKNISSTARQRQLSEWATSQLGELLLEIVTTHHYNAKW